MTESEFLRKEPCPECGSTDNLARYTDGHGYCFGCGHYEHGDTSNVTDDEPQQERRVKDLVAFGEPTAWDGRGITLESAEKWGFTRSTLGMETVRVFNYRDPKTQQVVAQKVRFKGKDFRFLGDAKEAGLYGMHLWRDGGKKVVVVEGELDAISLSQMQSHKWPVVSVPTGSKGARKALEKNIAWLEQFEEIVLMFDQDEPGQEAVAECQLVGFTPGKLKIAGLPLKDANEMLMAGRIKETIDCIWAARTYRPDGLVGIDDIIDEVMEDPVIGLPWWDERLTELTFGRRYGEVYGFGAGTGIGKTDWFMQQLAYDVVELNMMAGCIFLEQKPKETAKRAAGKFAGKRFHIPDGSWTKDELHRAVSELKGKVYFYDNFGQTEWDVVKGHIRYMAVSLGIRSIYLDHLTALAEDNEELGKIMKEMAGLAQELNILIHFISHLTTPDGKPHEEGGRVTIRHFRGSRSIGFWSFFMFGLERDQQAEDPEVASTTTFRCLKDRFTGNATGATLALGFDKETGKLVPKEPPNPFDEGGFRDETNPQTQDDDLPF